MKSIFDGKRSKKISNNRKKFITQNYIRGLPGDYKILFYGKKAFVTKRNNRKNDFRASGSGDFSFVNSGIDDVLDFAWSVFSHFDVPYMGLDISKKGKSFVLIEFQFLRFSNIPLQGSEGYFIKNKKWEFVEDENDLELIFCKAVDSYICKKWKDISM